MKTKSEGIFEEFLVGNNLKFNKINENGSPSPDYLVKAGRLELVFEVKELAEDENFRTEPSEVSSRRVGEHIRKKIHDARCQIQSTANRGIPSILLIYNNIDSMHSFGTENHDFICAMHGDYTVVINKTTGKITDSFHGRNKSFQERKNTSFSAIGRLSPYDGQNGKFGITLFENVFSKIKIRYEELPSCFDVIKDIILPKI